MFSWFLRKGSKPRTLTPAQRFSHWNNPNNAADCAKLFRHLLSGKRLSNLDAIKLCRMSPHGDKRLRDVRQYVRLADMYVERNGRRFKIYWVPDFERERVLKLIRETEDK